MTSSEAVPLTLAAVAADLQIRICTFLHPSDILSLRKTCKTFLIITKQRIIWICALRRLCLDNALFLPSFPIHDMSDMDIERVATAPCRWVERCAAWPKKQRRNARPQLGPITARVIQSPLDGIGVGVQTFIVPGGRYLVSNSILGMSLWDLGYTSKADCKLVASVEWDNHNFYTTLVNATSDGMGLIIVACRFRHCSVYEIHPLEGETPQLTRIAHNSHLDLRHTGNPPVLLMPNRVVYIGEYMEGIIFRVWDYRLNRSTSFLAEIDVQEVNYNFKAIATETTIIILYGEEILIWGIPPLSPQSVDFFDYPTPIPLLRRVPFPDDIIRNPSYVKCITMSSWYSGSSSSLHFDPLSDELKLYRFELVIKPDLNDVSLRVVTSTFHLPFYELNDMAFHSGGNYIRENPLVSTDSAVYFRSMPHRPARPHKILKKVLLSATSIRQPSSCSNSGRFVYPDIDNKRIVVLDFI